MDQAEWIGGFEFLEKEFQCAFLETYHGIEDARISYQKLQHSPPKYHEMSLKM